MITGVTISNLTVFHRARLTPVAGLNVIVGENGTGKTHLLELLYAVVSVLGREKGIAGAPPTKAFLQSAIADKLVGVFRPETLGRLARRRQGRERCDIAMRFSRPADRISFVFATNSKTDVQIDELPDHWLPDTAAYIPTRELLTIFPNFISVYEGHYLEFEETWRDTCVALGAPLVRGPRQAFTRTLLDPLETAMGGSIDLDKSGKFYLQAASGRMEIPLVAEGLRKLGMIARLIATGRLAGNGYLFWDEPEANLNPKLIKSVAQTILELSAGGIQVFIATHSLFLLRELEILRVQSTSNESGSIRFFGLSPSDGGVQISAGDDLSDIKVIASLDEELAQSDRYLDA